MKKVVYFLIISFNSLVFAGWSPSEFLNIGVGARALAMGSAFISVADDATSIYWNPAGLGSISSKEITFMLQSPAGTPNWENIKKIIPKYQFGSIVIPLKFLYLNDNPTLGMGWIYSVLYDVPYTYLQQDGTIFQDFFKYRNLAIITSFGDKIHLKYLENLYYGFSIRWVLEEFHKIENGRANGFDFVAGIIYEFYPEMRFGLTLSKGTVMTWQNGNVDTSPLTVKIGSSKKITLTRTITILPSLDIFQKQTYPLMLNTGLESLFSLSSKETMLKNLSLRLGLSDIVLEKRYENKNDMNECLAFTTGIGFRFEYQALKLSFDYMFGFYRLGDKHKFSFTFYY